MLSTTVTTGRATANEDASESAGEPEAISALDAVCNCAAGEPRPTGAPAAREADSEQLR